MTEETATQSDHGNVNTSATLRRVAKPKMVNRSLRVPEKLWEAAKERADEREENISDVIREALRRYIEDAGDEDA